MQLRYQAAGQEGYEAVVTADSGLAYFREFGVLRLGPGERYQGRTGDCEAIVHLIEGACRLSEAGGLEAALGGRDTPFSGRPAAVFLPPGTDYQVHAGDRAVEVTLTLAPAEAGGAARAITPEDVTPKQVGRDNWQRTVTMIAPPGFPSRRLILGETNNPPGNWSGVPAHKHDEARPGLESVHEELYYFRADRPGGWGVERVYGGRDQDGLILLGDRVVTLKPRGYHTVAAAPGFGLYYSFVLSGPRKELIPYLDPAQAWLAG